MSSESHYLNRVELAQTFRAPSNVAEFCMDCGQLIKPDELVQEIGDYELIHLDCLEALMEQARDGD